MKSREAANALLQGLAVVVHGTLALGHGYGIFRPIPPELRGMLAFGRVQGLVYNFELGNWSDETIHGFALLYLFLAAQNGKRRNWLDVVANIVFCGHDSLSVLRHRNHRKELIKAG